MAQLGCVGSGHWWESVSADLITPCCLLYVVGWPVPVFRTTDVSTCDIYVSMCLPRAGRGNVVLSRYGLFHSASYCTLTTAGQPPSSFDGIFTRYFPTSVVSIPDTYGQMCSAVGLR
jgi:hypothetical protein